jgi:hypothetical protein
MRLHSTSIALAALFMLAACGDDSRPSGGDSGPARVDGGGVRTDAGPRPDGSSRADTGATGTLCTETCEYTNDGACDDGGPDSMFSVCDFGTDCIDCGPRDPSMCTPDCDGATCGPDGCGGMCGTCGAMEMCVAGTCESCECMPGQCGTNACGMDCGMCMGSMEMCYREACRTPSCMGRTCGRDAAGGYCGTGEMGACPDGQGCLDGTCVPCACGARTCGTIRGCAESCGTCADPMVCDNVMGTCVMTPDAMCNNTCSSAGDNECDDGGPDSLFSLCELGSDCADCGPR